MFLFITSVAENSEYQALQVLNHDDQVINAVEQLIEVLSAVTSHFAKFNTLAGWVPFLTSFQTVIFWLIILLLSFSWIFRTAMIFSPVVKCFGLCHSAVLVLCTCISA